MDNLDDLPEGNTTPTPQEEEIMSRMFGAGKAEPLPPPPPAQKEGAPSSAMPDANVQQKKKGSLVGGGSSNKLKVIAIATGLFLILSIPFIDGMVGAIPYANMAPTWILKTLLFAIIIAITVWFLC